MTTAIDKYTLARSSPAGFAWVVSDGAWEIAPHLRLLSERIVDVASGRCPRLIVTMPPRHGKSELISRYTPAWFLGNFPDKKVMLASYADTFAAQWGRKSRELLDEWGPKLWGVRLSTDSKGGQQWEVAAKKGGKKADGVMVTAGVGGGLTGKGAHLLIIDDPVKNAEEAQSERIRQAHHDWWKSTARTRLQAGAGVILVMTRWHEDDLAGRLLADAAEDGDQWEILNLPGICEDKETDPLHRDIGEALWPKFFDNEWMGQTKRAMGTYWFTAMYQQRPAPADGMLFKRQNFRYFQKHDVTDPTKGQLVTIHKDSGPLIFDTAYGTKFTTVDVAASEKEQADYTVAATWVKTVDNDLLLWDLERVQFDGPDLLPFLRRIYFEQRPALMCIERLGFGLTIIQELLREGLPIVRLEPDKDKITRALPACARYEENRIFHPRGAYWVDDFESELLVFPNGKNDDQVDTVSYAALQLPFIGAGTHSTLVRHGISNGRGKTITGGLMAKEF
jgi:predicted phage terminase large subunit-like protein